MDKVTIQTLIKDRSAERGDSYAEIARKLGTSRNAVSKWARGATVPSVERWPALAEYLGITALELRDILEASPLENQASQWGDL